MRKKLPTRQHRLYPFYLLIALELVFSIVYGYWWGRQNLAEATRVVEETLSGFGFIASLPASAVLIFIFLNNAVKSFVILVLGFLLGIFPFYFIYINGQLIGLLLAVAAPAVGWNVILASLLPHGIWELSGVVIAGGYGVWLAIELLRSIAQKSSFKNSFKYAVRGFARKVLPLLFIAAIIETYITPAIIKLMFQLSLRP